MLTLTFWYAGSDIPHFSCLEHSVFCVLFVAKLGKGSPLTAMKRMKVRTTGKGAAEYCREEAVKIMEGNGFTRSRRLFWQSHSVYLCQYNISCTSLWQTHNTGKQPVIHQN